MSYFTTTLAIVAGASIAFGLLYLFMGLRRPRGRGRYLLFAGFALAYAGAVLAARAGYLAAAGTDFIVANQVVGVLAPAAWIFLLWYVASYTALKPRWLLSTLSVLYGFIAIASLLTPELIVGDASDVATLVLPWGEEVMHAAGEDTALLPVVLVAQLVSLGFVITANVRQFRRGDREQAAFLAVGTAWFIVTVVVDLLVSLGVIDLVFVSDVGFIGFVLAISLQMAKSNLDTEQQLLTYQSNLESIVAERTAELEAAQASLLKQAAERATVAERGRLARELHDVVTQLLFSINLIAQSLPRLWERDPEQAKRNTEELRRLTRGALAEMRTLLRELRPQTIVETDLGTLVTQLAEALAARHDLVAEIETARDVRLPNDVHLALYRIAQESVSNIAKHSDASTLWVELVGDDEHVRLSIRDDGLGFETAAPSAGSHGLGIMEERVVGIGAELTVRSEPGRGTEIEVDWRDPREEVPDE